MRPCRVSSQMKLFALRDLMGCMKSYSRIFQCALRLRGLFATCTP